MKPFQADIGTADRPDYSHSVNQYGITRMRGTRKIMPSGSHCDFITVQSYQGVGKGEAIESALAEGEEAHMSRGGLSGGVQGGATTGVIERKFVC
jgi:hypothetical protein